MKAALRGSYVEYVIYSGVTEKYPPWFRKIIYDSTIGDSSNYTFYVYHDERTYDYYEKKLVEDYSVFLRKPNGDVHVTDYDAFSDVYMAFTYNEFTHSGIAAIHRDVIEYVECQPGILPAGYPEWFYAYFTEALNYPQDDKTFFFYDTDKHVLTASRESVEITAGGDVTVTERCVFLYNRFGEIRGLTYDEFLKYYDPNPRIGEW